MITRNDIHRITQRASTRGEILTIYLDMSVNSDNKRTYQVFLNKEKARFAELESDRANHHREPLGAAFAKVEQWIAESFDPTNKGVSIFTDVAGDWQEAFQFPVAVRNRLEILPHPVVGPLTELVHNHPIYALMVVDREHLHLVSLRMNAVGEDYRLEPEAYPTPADVQAGGYAHKDYQKYKAEEMRQFFREFAAEVQKFEQRVRPDHWVLLGTHENTQHFREFLPASVLDRTIHTGHAASDETGVELARRIEPVIEEIAERHEAEALDTVHDRVRQSHFAIAGMHETLVQLQEGKVERLVVARDLQKDGVQCTQCGFYLVRRDGACPYCGGSLRDGIDLVESVIRIATAQDVEVDFVAGDAMRDLKGVAALLKF